MSDLGDSPFARKKIISVKEEVEISETQLLEQVFDEVEATHANPCVKTEKESEVVNGQCHETEDNQTELIDCEAIREQPYECNLRPDDSTRSTRKHDIRPSLKNHTCSICAKSFRSSSRLEEHMNVHTGSRPYACKICPRKYASRYVLREHILTHGSGLQCTVCGKTYKSRSRLKNHMKIHPSERNFQCEICSKSFTSKYRLSRHHKTHSAVKKKYECTLCSEKFADNYTRLRHEKTHTNNYSNYYECGNCKKYFRLEDQYRSHLERNKCKCYASEKPFECSKCENESFVSIELLNQHKIEVHPPPRKNHACSVCAKAFSCKSRVRRHMNIHTGSRPYACTVCPKKYSLRDKLRQHMLTHLSAEAKKRFKLKCALCEKFYSSRGRLNSHMNMHRGERPFKCETCPRTFASPGTLSSHKKLHADDGENECTLCNQKCTNNYNRRKHEETHTNSKWKYQCPKCKKYFRLDDQYRSHLKDNKCKGYASEKPFECSKCENESFVSIELLNQHKVKTHPPPKKNHICLICTKAYEYKSLLSRHMNSHTRSRPYKCPMCPKWFNRPDSLSRHKLTHNFLSADIEIRCRFKCTLCEKSYGSKINLNSHMYVHRDERPFKCEICPKSYTSARTLKLHKKLHADDGKNECTFCNKKFAYNKQRHKHEQMHTNSQWKYQCAKCKMYFRLEDQHRSHLEDNKCKGFASEKLFECSKCENESFVSIELLRQHKVEIHSPTKRNHACSV